MSRGPIKKGAKLEFEACLLKENSKHCVGSWKIKDRYWNFKPDLIDNTFEEIETQRSKGITLEIG